MIEKLTPLLTQQVLSYVGKAAEGYEYKFRKVVDQISTLTQQYKFRQIKQKDNHVVRDLIKKILLERGGIGIESLYYDRELDNIFDFYNMPGHHFGVMVYKKEIIGTAGIGKTNFFDNNNESCELKKFYLRKEFRGKGQGTMMMNSILKEAAGYGYVKCFVRVDDHNIGAIKFFEKEGFYITDAFSTNKQDHQTILVKDLHNY